MAAADGEGGGVEWTGRAQRARRGRRSETGTSSVDGEMR